MVIRCKWISQLLLFIWNKIFGCLSCNYPIIYLVGLWNTCWSERPAFFGWPHTIGSSLCELLLLNGYICTCNDFLLLYKWKLLEWETGCFWLTSYNWEFFMWVHLYNGYICTCNDLLVLYKWKFFCVNLLMGSFALAMMACCYTVGRSLCELLLNGYICTCNDSLLPSRRGLRPMGPLLYSVSQQWADCFC